MLREAEKVKASLESIQSEKERNTSRLLPLSSLPQGAGKRRGRASATAGPSAFRSSSGANFLERARKEVQGRNIFGIRNQLMSRSTDAAANARRQQQQQQQTHVGKAGKTTGPSSSTTMARPLQSASISANSTSRSGAVSDETRSTKELPSCLRRAPPPRALASAGNMVVGTQTKAISSQAASPGNHGKTGRGNQSSSSAAPAATAMARSASLSSAPESTRATALAQSRAAASAERAARVAEAQERRQRALAAVAGNPFQVPSLPPPPASSAASSTLPPRSSSSSVAVSAPATSAGTKKGVAGSKRDADGNVVVRGDGRTKTGASTNGGDGVDDGQSKSKSRRRVV